MEVSSHASQCRESASGFAGHQWPDMAALRFEQASSVGNGMNTKPWWPVALLSLVASFAFTFLVGCASVALSSAVSDPVSEVTAAELSFARSIAERDFEAFAAHVAEEAVFINGGKPLRGKTAVLDFWRRFFHGPVAPFSWRPELVEVTSTGDLAYSEGPVSSPQGKVIARFYSTWRRSSTGTWLVVFDNGYDVCECPK